ncbi:MAG TPA: hypothetical protein VMW49_03705 [Candidatus Dormibacteraeota bacterium]|nr:hypothetical protein [Candidatus Dormibacteraeota bacterium]
MTTGPDPELDALFGATRSPDPPELHRFALALQRLFATRSAPTADPRFRARLRAQLMREAAIAGRRRGRWGFRVGTGLGLAGTAMLAVAILSLVAFPPGPETVVAQSQLTGRHVVLTSQVIRLTFNRPMAERVVDRGLRVSPAVAYRVEWPDPQTMIIRPVHHLVADVAYVVTIPRSAARAQNGAVAVQPIVIPFGTAPAALVAPTLPGVSGVTVAAQVRDPAGLIFGASGTLWVAGTAVAGPGAPPLALATPTPTPLISPTPSPTPSLATQPLPASTPPTSPGTALPQPVPGTAIAASGSPRPVALVPVRPPAAGRAWTVGTPVPAAALANLTLSPDQTHFAGWALPAGRPAVLVAASTTGTGTAIVLATSTQPNPVAYWAGNGNLLYTANDQLMEVNLDGRTRPVHNGVTLGAGGFFSLAPGGSTLFARPGGMPTVYDLATGQAVQLPGLIGLPTWSPSGTSMAFVREIGAAEAIQVASADGHGASDLATLPPGTIAGGLSYSPNGRVLAVTEASAAGQMRLALVDTRTGSLSTPVWQTGIGDPTWNRAGSAIAVLATTVHPEVARVLVVSLTRSEGGGASPASAAHAAAATLAADQIGGPSAAAQAQTVLAPGLQIPAASLFPGPFDRFYVVAVGPASTGPDLFVASVRLIRDGTTSSPPAYLPEQMTLRVSGGMAMVTGLTAGLLSPIPSGPLVLHAGVTADGPATLMFTLQFDSDLSTATVTASAVTLTVGETVIRNLRVAYAPDTQTVTISAGPLPDGPVTLSVGSPLADINGTAMGSVFHLTLPSTHPPTLTA